ncbi:MAG TPA: TonB-dependent receptor plug domain-containing protein, partial [Caulobacteraceae bacterium]|nr:TonB-dependent receptor plug domain-containing protein [Caulobacteraceae bacterium]
MRSRTVALCGASILVLAAAGPVLAQPASTPSAAGPTSAIGELVVTAQKREQNIQTVGMSIQAATGAQLLQQGITSTEDLKKIIPGFEVTPNYYGTNVFTIRGVGFQDTSLAGSPTVTVYQDEAPLPFSILTSGATLDLQRVEVLKGPQGTLFGNNATAGAINYIANKPTDFFDFGGHVTVGNFQTVNVEAYVSGPIAQGLDLRL